MAAAGKWKLYHTAKEKIAKGIIDLDTHSFKMLLFLSTSNCDTLTHDELADLTNQHAGANGYTTDGQVMTSVTVTNTAGVIAFDADPVIWTASGGSIIARHAVIIDDTVAGDPLVATCILDLAPADVEATDTNDFKITPHATGYFTLGGADSN